MNNLFGILLNPIFLTLFILSTLYVPILLLYNILVNFCSYSDIYVWYGIDGNGIYGIGYIWV